VVEENGKLIVYIPNNLESLSDNKLSIAAVAAIRLLKADVRFCNKDADLDQLDKRQQLYVSGVAWGLSNNGGDGTLAPYVQVSGSLGHGYYWVAHEAMAKQYGSAWFAKGKPWHLTRGLTGKAWDSSIKPDTRRISSLVSRAAKKINCSASWRTYFRAPETFLGREIKRSLPHRRTGIITANESVWFSQTYSKAIKAYDDMILELQEPKEENLSSLQARIKSVGTSLQNLEIQADKLISRRVRFIYPSNKKEKKAALRKPIEDLIAEMDAEDYVSAFDPSLLKIQRAFSVPLRGAQEDLDVFLLRARRDYESRVNSLKQAGDETLARIASGWADNAFCPIPSSD
jgi:hypothetical protein